MESGYKNGCNDTVKSSCCACCHFGQLCLLWGGRKDAKSSLQKNTKTQAKVEQTDTEREEGEGDTQRTTLVFVEEKDTHEKERAAPEERRRWLMIEIKVGSMIERGR